MYLSEVLDMYGPILLDDYSATKLGENDHLEVVGWAGRIRSHKRYVIYCDICARDEELYGDGYFTNLKADLEVGKIPCGCASGSRKTEKQYEVLIKRALEGTDIQFCGWSEPFNKSKTKCILSCNLHGSWDYCTIGHVLHGKLGCPECRKPLISLRMKRPDDLMVEKLLSTNAFHKDTVFNRSPTLNKRGYRISWYVTCGSCNITYESQYSNLMLGKIGCGCGTHDYRFCYINTVRDNENIIALKFGVSKDSSRRMKEQNRYCVYDIENFGVWEFQSKQDCLLSEKLCLSELICGIIPKSEMEDGWTETTFTYNLEKIIKIYEQFGGIRLD